MACPKCGGIERTTLPDGRYRCQSPVQINGHLLDVVPPHLSGTPAGVPIYGKPLWGSCGNVYTKHESESYSRYWEAKTAQDEADRKYEAQLDHISDPIEQLIRAVAHFVVIVDEVMELEGGRRRPFPAPDPRRSQLASLGVMCGQSVIGGNWDSNEIARWFAAEATAKGKQPPETVAWPVPKRSLFGGDPRRAVQFKDGRRERAWVLPAKISQPPSVADMRRPALISQDGRLFSESRALSMPSLVWLANWLGYHVRWESRLMPLPGQ